MSRLLVIDDSLTVRKVVELSLRNSAWLVDFAANGADGVAATARFSPWPHSFPTSASSCLHTCARGGSTTLARCSGACCRSPAWSAARMESLASRPRWT